MVRIGRRAFEKCRGLGIAHSEARDSEIVEDGRGFPFRAQGFEGVCRLGVTPRLDQRGPRLKPQGPNQAQRSPGPGGAVGEPDRGFEVSRGHQGLHRREAEVDRRPVVLERLAQSTRPLAGAPLEEGETGSRQRARRRRVKSLGRARACLGMETPRDFIDPRGNFESRPRYANNLARDRPIGIESLRLEGRQGFPVEAADDHEPGGPQRPSQAQARGPGQDGVGEAQAFSSGPRFLRGQRVFSEQAEGQGQSLGHVGARPGGFRGRCRDRRQDREPHPQNRIQHRGATRST